MSASTYQELKNHVGHDIECVTYGNGVNVALVCNNCQEILTDYDAESEPLVLDNQIEKFPKKEKETVWRLQEEDFLDVMEEKFPHLSEEQRKNIIERAHDKFSVEGWTDYVESFIECYID